MGTGNGFLRDLGRALSWHRRLLAAGLAAGSLALALHVVEPAPAATTGVVTAARDLSSGTRLARSDLRVTQMPPDIVPAGAFLSDDPPVGRVVAAPVRAGEPMTDTRLLGRSLLESYGPDAVAAPVRLADPGAVALLRVGDHIDVLAASTEAEDPGRPARTVAGDATVVALPRPRADDVSEAGLVTGGLVVLAVGPDTAADLARAEVTARLSAVLRRPGPGQSR